MAAATLAAVLAAAVAATAAAATWVPYPQVLAQVRSGPLIRAIINPIRKDVEIKFRNLDEWHAYYPPGAQPELQRLLAARHVRVLFVARHHRAAAPKRVHHHLRYIVGGVLVGLLVAGSLGYLLWWRRRGRRGARAAPER
jgi:hypothetical protein